MSFSGKAAWAGAPKASTEAVAAAYTEYRHGKVRAYCDAVFRTVREHEGTLGRAGINIRAIAQGSSERNISVVVDSDESVKALRAAHSGFYLSAKTISIGLIGPGTVGTALLRQIEKQGEKLREKFNIDLRIRAISRSQHFVFPEFQNPPGRG